VQKYFVPRLVTTKIDAGISHSLINGPYNKSVFLYLGDGSILEMKTYLQDYVFYFDKKAFDEPNIGQNAFVFMFNPLRTDAGMNTYTYGKGFEPYAWGWDGTRAQLLQKCSTGSRLFCTKLIQYDGWKILDDYPFKF
jgi:hypothetical protein